MERLARHCNAPGGDWIHSLPGGDDGGGGEVIQVVEGNGCWEVTPMMLCF